MAENKLSPAEKYRQLKKHTEEAGMRVVEKDGKIVVRRDSAYGGSVKARKKKARLF